MGSTVSIGIVGLDTSHVKAFAELLHDAGHPQHVKGAKIVAAFPGGSPDIDKSWSRVAGYTDLLRDQYGVRILSSPAAVAEACDIVFLASIDGRVHLAQLKQVISFKRPVFVDKPLATRSDEAREMYRLAAETGVPLMSTSSQRYADTLTDALADASLGSIVGCDAFGPMSLLTEPPGFFWYGIHTAEVIYAAMGTGCVSLQVTGNDDFDLITATWSDGRVASLRGSRKGHGRFGATLHRHNGFQQVDLSNTATLPYRCLLLAILRSLPLGHSDVPAAQTLELIRFLEAANESKRSGERISL